MILKKQRQLLKGLRASFGSVSLDVTPHSRLTLFLSALGQPGEVRPNDPSPLIVPLPTDSIPEISPSLEVAEEEPATSTFGGGFELRPRLQGQPSRFGSYGSGIRLG